MAVDDAYGAEQWREGEAGGPDEVAYRTERIERRESLENGTKLSLAGEEIAVSLVRA